MPRAMKTEWPEREFVPGAIRRCLLASVRNSQNFLSRDRLVCDRSGVPGFVVQVPDLPDVRGTRSAANWRGSWLLPQVVNIKRPSRRVLYCSRLVPLHRNMHRRCAEALTVLSCAQRSKMALHGTRSSSVLLTNAFLFKPVPVICHGGIEAGLISVAGLALILQYVSSNLTVRVSVS
jgi:hypothetical protein